MSKFCDVIIFLSSFNYKLLLGPAKVNKVTLFSGPYYMIKRVGIPVLTFASGVQESVLLHFISENKVKILHEVKTCHKCLHQKFFYKNEKTCISFMFCLNF